MITLPTTVLPRMGEPQLIDFGFFQRPSTGGAVTRIDRAGMRHRVEFTFPPTPADTARIYLSRIERAKSEGIRMPFLLMGVDQSGGGTPVVSGTSAAGTSLPVTGMTPAFVVKEGWWLSVVDADDVSYLHHVTADTTVAGGGTATLPIWPPLRGPLPNAAVIQLTAPIIEGNVVGDFKWPQPVDGLIEFGFSVEEAA